MSQNTSIITNLSKIPFGYVTAFEENSWQDLFLKFREKHPHQTPKASLLHLDRIKNLSSKDVTKILSNLMPNSKVEESGTVVSDGEYTFFLEDYSLNNPGKLGVYNDNDQNGSITGNYFVSQERINDWSVIDLKTLGDRYLKSKMPRKGWLKKTGDVSGRDIISLVMEFRGCGLMAAIEYVLEVLNVDLSTSHITQPQMLEGSQFEEFSENYHGPVEFHYDERLFEGAIKHPQYTITGKLSYWLFEFKFDGKIFFVFCTLQCNVKTGEYSWMLVAPPDEYLNEELYTIQHGTPKNIPIEVTMQAMSRTLDELKQMDFVKMDRACSYFGRGELVYIVGPPKTYKSFFTQDLAQIIAGGDVSDPYIWAKNPLPVLYLNSEMEGEIIVKRSDQLEPNYKYPERGRGNIKFLNLLSSGIKLDLSTKEGQDFIENELAIQGAKVLVIDHQGQVIPHSAQTQPERFKLFSCWCEKLTKMMGITVIVLQHENKQGGITGSGIQLHNADLVMWLKRLAKCSANSGQVELHITHTRHLSPEESAPLLLQYANKGDHIQRIVRSLEGDADVRKNHLVTEEEIEKHSLSDLEAEILHKARLGPVKAGDFISKGTRGRSASNVTKALGRLCSLGVLEKHGVGSGTYYTAIEKVQEGI